ncbi:MAG TPA: hypothetical protein VMN36_08825 [Verrucomicrobiales bacterium]|nr:hypothetical protein [Verrucomicrobiales bacterium]
MKAAGARNKAELGPIDAESERSAQGVFDFESGHLDGFANWRREQESRLEAIREEWGLPVGRKVRIRLHTMDGELEGMLRLATMPVSVDRRIPLRLRLGRVDLTPPDIESWVVID